MTEEDFLSFFEKAIDKRVENSGNRIDTPEVMKDTFQECVNLARKERWAVICSFKESFEEFNQNGKGFGVSFNPNPHTLSPEP